MEIDWESTCLQDLLLHDKWNPYHGIGFIAGFNFSDSSEHRKATNNDLLYWLAKNDEYYFMDCYVTYTRLIKLWKKSVHSELLECTPEFLINWALSKRVEPDWLDWAIDKGLVSNINKELLVGTKINQKELFNKDSSTYPLELDWAMQAWEAVRNDKSKGKPKAKIKAWLNANTQLSNEAKDRISIVVNWDKTGGATRTD